MTEFRVTDDFERTSTRLDFSEFRDIADGATIVSMADWGDGVEFGLSENLMLRFSVGNDGKPVVSVLSTLNQDDDAPVRLKIVGDDEAPEAMLVEQRLTALRRAYAIVLMLLSNRQDELAEFLEFNVEADLEFECIPENERLQLEAAGPGSFWITVFSAIRGAPKLSANTLSLIFSDGRDLLLDRVRANTELKRQEAERARDQRLIELSKALDEVKHPAARAAIEESLNRALQAASPKLAPPTVAGLLEGPKREPRM